MDLELSPEEQSFRDEVRDFLDKELTAEIREAARRTTAVWVDKPIVMEWHRKLYEKGWIGYFWPKEYGGTGWTPAQQYIFLTESALAGAPPLIPMSLRYVGPVIFNFGDDWQKEYFLPKILSGEHYWCQGYSEPGAGSDLAALKCKAERDGDEYVINGTKIWTTNAHVADWIFCLVRTDGSGKKQEGITFIVIDMNTPGITVEPIITMDLDHDVNQVFFDNVRVPVKNRVGEEGAGWGYGKFLLEFERAGGSCARLKADLAHLKMIASAQHRADQPLIEDPAFATEVTKVEIGITGLELTERQILSRAVAGAPPGPEGSILNAQAVQYNQRMTELAVEAMDYYALPFIPGRPFPGANEYYPGPDYAPPVMGQYLNRRATSIYGGSDEVQREIISKMLIGR
ncbi:MAG: acyl-CoA dehydrogenase family protein [Alphaproteobacteria bacterium]